MNQKADLVRVLYLTHSAQLSGAELALTRIIPALEVVDPLVVLPENGPLQDRFNELNVPVEVIPLAESVTKFSRLNQGVQGLSISAVKSLLTYSSVLAELIRERRLSLVHTNSAKSHLYGGVAANLARVPQVWHAHDRLAAPFMSAQSAMLLKTAARFLPRGLLANSKSTAATLPRLRRAHNFMILNNPTTLQRRAGARAEHSEHLVVGMVGRIAPWKGQLLFLRAFARAFRGTNARARIIGAPLFGEEDYLNQLRLSTVELGIAEQVSFVGFVSDVEKALAELDILVHASTVPEPFGQVIVEGMAAGVPVVASAEGGPLEIIENGVSGVLFPARSESALADSLTALASDERLRTQLVEGASRVIEQYRPAQVASALVSFYRQLS